MTSTPGFSIRAARRSDLPVLERLIERSVRELSVGLYSSAQIDSALRFVFGVDTRLVDHGTYYVVERDHTIVAAGGWSRWGTLFGADHFKTADEPELDPAVDSARIRAFFVDPAWTRRGLARMLFDTCVAEARASGFRRLELMATLPGKPLYEALGFSADEPVMLTLADGVSMPLVRMSRSLARVSARLSVSQAVFASTSKRQRAPWLRSQHSRTGIPTTAATSSSTAWQAFGCVRTAAASGHANPRSR